MARTSLFDTLRTLFHDTSDDRQHAARPPASAISRRQLLSSSLAGLSAAYVLAPRTALARGRPQPRVAIIGGGMAGLTCAYRLRQAGVFATVYESSRRVGGRMYSARPGYPNDQLVELGGEFIDSSHVHLHNLADELGIELVDREAESVGVTRGELFVVAGREVPEAVIAAQFRQALPRMRLLAAQADSEDPAYDPAVYDALNQQSLASWLAQNLADVPELQSVLSHAYRGEYGLEPEEQSALNLLFLVTTGESDALSLFGISDERYHAKLGSQGFPDELAKRLRGQVVLSSKLVAARSHGRGYRLELERHGRRYAVSADLVVFALPFTKLRQVDLTGLPLSAEKREVIEQVGYGTNVKLMGAFQKRVWRDAHSALGSVTADQPYQQAWDTSIGQRGDSGVLTNFLGGKYGLESAVGSAERWYTQAFLPGIERLFPGTAASYVRGSAVRMDWPNHPHTSGSYLCYRPGQWDYFGLEAQVEGRGTLHFCGEHTSLDNQGFMEGAAESGELTAGALLERLELEASPRHQWMLRFARAVQQPALGEPVRRASFVARKRERGAALREIMQEGEGAAHRNAQRAAVLPTRV